MTKRTCGKECDNKCENEKDKECDKEDIVTKLVTDKEDSVTRSVTKRMTRTVTRRTVRSPWTSPALSSLHAFMLHLIPPAAQLQSAFAVTHKKTRSSTACHVGPLALESLIILNNFEHI